MKDHCDYNNPEVQKEDKRTKEQVIEALEDLAGKVLSDPSIRRSIEYHATNHIYDKIIDRENLNKFDY